MGCAKIVLDTNVVFSGLYSRLGVSFLILSRVGSGAFELQLSAPLVAEYEAVLKRGRLQLSDEQVDDVIDYLCAQGVHHEIFYLWRPVLKDPDDDFVLELAVKSQATIVTWNVADFKKASLFGVGVMTPKELLKQLEKKP
jgi:putative PIN family toxin of toxin-antitoxin system